MTIGTVKNDLPSEAAEWLQGIGNISEYKTVSELKEDVNDPSTQTIGVINSENEIHILLSGDELKLYKTAREF